MRLWTVHPRYLDAKGLVAAWREALLAQKVLAGGTRGYKHHPQLIRFRDHSQPLRVMSAFLTELQREAVRRGYEFDARKILKPGFTGKMNETHGQLDFEWAHLLKKLRVRDPARHRDFKDVVRPDPHPLFRIVPGKIRDWEKT